MRSARAAACVPVRAPVDSKSSRAKSFIDTTPIHNCRTQVQARKMHFTLQKIAAAVLWLLAMAAVTSAASDRKPICLMYLTGQVVLAQCYLSRGNQ